MSATQVMSQLTFLDKYSRFIRENGRRETWDETVKRVTDYLAELAGVLKEDEYKLIHDAIFNREVGPSMRLMSTAGIAARENSASIFNCSYLPLEGAQDFHDLTLLLGLGVGVGFSVEKHFVDSFGMVREATGNTYTYKIGDDIYSWAQSVKFLVEHAMNGDNVAFDYSLIRPAGSPLKTRGGRASGPAPLMDAHGKIQELITSRRGMKLTTIDAFDIACHVAGAIVSGGVRRCLPSGSLVHTKGGMIPIEDVEIGTHVLTSRGYFPVSNKFEQGVQKVVRVVTQDSSFECTPNHKIAVLTGKNSYVWKMASELQFGDKLISPSVAIDGTTQTMPSFSYERPKHSTTCKDILIPALDEDMAWLLGLLHGDGYVGKLEVTIPIHGEQVEVGVRAKKQLERFGVNVGLTEYENYFVLRVKSKQLADYFGRWLKKPNTSIEVPDFVWKSTYDIKMAYVSGVMDADGSTKTKPINVVTTIYEDFAKQIQLLLSSCGIQSRIKRLSESNLKENWKPKFAVSLINNASKVAFLESPTLFKNEFVISKAEQRTNIFADGVVWSQTDSPLIPVTFIRLEDVEESVETWDLEVEEAHEFFAQGYLVHNSAMIAIFDKDDKLMLDAKSYGWWEENLQRQYANISVVIDEYLFEEDVDALLQRQHDSKSGEPGIFSRYAIRASMPKRRKLVANMGTNP